MISTPNRLTCFINLYHLNNTPYLEKIEFLNSVITSEIGENLDFIQLYFW